MIISLSIAVSSYIEITLMTVHNAYGQCNARLQTPVHTSDKVDCRILVYRPSTKRKVHSTQWSARPHGDTIEFDAFNKDERTFCCQLVQLFGYKVERVERLSHVMTMNETV